MSSSSATCRAKRQTRIHAKVWFRSVPWVLCVWQFRGSSRISASPEPYLEGPNHRVMISSWVEEANPKFVPDADAITQNVVG